MSRDAREAASDRRSTFGSAMTREQIEALSDDPDEMAQQLQDIAGGNAVDPRRQLRRRPPAAEVGDQGDPHHARRVRGREPLRRRAVHRHHHAARHRAAPHQPEHAVPRRLAERRPARAAARHANSRRGPKRTQSYNGGIGGSLIKQKASFSINLNSNTTFDTPYLHYYTPDGTLVEGLAPRRPRDNMFVFGLFDYAITQGPDAARQLQPQPVHEQGHRRQRVRHARARLRHRGPQQHAAHPGSGPARPPVLHQHARVDQLVGARMRSSVFEGPTIRVLEGFTSGGQQQQGGVAIEDAQPGVGSRLRARHPLGAHRHAARRRLVSLERLGQLPRHLHVRKPRWPTATARRRATPSARATRTSPTRTSRPAGTCRTTSGSART